MAIFSNRQPVYVDGEPRGRRRVATILLAIVLAYLLFADFAPRVGIDVQGSILSMLGIKRTSNADVVAGPAGANGEPGADGLNGVPGVDGKDGLNGLAGAAGPRGQTGAAGADGVNGVDGIDGAPGADGADGVVLSQNEGAIGFGSCDDNVGVSLASRIDPTTAIFSVKTIRFTDVAAACHGLGLRVYLFSGSEGAYTLEATSDIVTIPSSSSFVFDAESLNIGAVASADLSKLAFEIAG